MTRRHFIEVYRDTADQWRWRKRSARNHKVVSHGECHPSKSNAVRAALAANPELSRSDVREVTA